jgi:hypothetical protein
MSLLDRGRETVVIYPEVEFEDDDGNLMTGPAEVGIPTRATVQLKAQSGTSSRRADLEEEGFETERVYRLRLPRSFTDIIGAQGQIEWRGERWVIFGDHDYYNGSSRTAHVEYTIRRS